MKKIILTFAVVIAMGISAVAQDGFFRSDAGGYVDRSGDDSGMSDVTPNLVGGPVGGSDNDAPAPLGSGLLILTALGAGYAVTRRREK
ncbi:MAG: hypothetical protein II817_05035 [Bacteroidales bacterium]|nr:hypothetical protein [Bacteroidales bacterium]